MVRGGRSHASAIPRGLYRQGQCSETDCYRRRKK